MTTNVLVFGFGAILLLVAIIGGGFELKEFKVPKVSRVTRAVAGIMGLFFIGWGVEIGITREAPPQQQAQDTRPTPQPAEVPARVTPPPSVERNVGWQTPIDQTQRRNQWQADVRRQLINAAGLLTQGHYELTHEPYTDRLYTHWTQDLILTLDAGRRYALVGVCDRDCSDLDLVLYDEDGYIVDSDTEPDDTPIVSVTPRETARYRLHVMMASCAVQPCYYGVGVFGR